MAKALCRKAALFTVLFCALARAALGDHLAVGYYKNICPAAESIVLGVVKSAFHSSPEIAAKLIRLHFHDCFVRASPIRYPLWWDVPAGRKDGNISLASNIPGNLPPPTFSVTQLTQLFASKGLSQDEMVTLSGAHTIGVSHCTSFVSRLYNFNGPNTTDPSLDPSYAQKLKQKCPQGSPNNANTTMVMDPETPFILDNLYYNDVIAKRGLFTSDATLLTNPNTKSSVLGNSGSYHLVAWQKKFAGAMIKMGEISVLTGTQGGVHAKCRVANS